MLGAHSDSVEAGPGLNDDGSGTVAILEVAKNLAKYGVNNMVRFGWWSGEESGLVGSTFYAKHLSQLEISKVKAYLNFDMIASPNFQYGIFDGDGDKFNMTGPKGSAAIEKLFQNYYENLSLNWTGSPFDGRSDYKGFIDLGIPAGGLFTGAEAKKTEEEAILFGGEAGVAFDVNYHGAGDNVTNLNMEPFIINAKAIAHAVATYAQSFGNLTLSTTARRWHA